MTAKPLEVCILTTSHTNARIGGAQYQIDCLLDELVRRGNCRVTYMARSMAPAQTALPYSAVRVKTGAVSRLGYLPDALALYRALSRLGPDVIYQRVGCAYTGIAAAWAKHRGARMIWHVAHDNDVMRESLRDKGNPVRVLLEKRSLEFGVRRATQIVTQTHQQAQLLCQNYGRSPTAVIPNFQPLPAERIDKSGTPIVAWVAGLKPWKRPEVFVRLAARLRDLAGVRFVMAGGKSQGSGDRQWTAELMAAVSACPNLEYVGERTQAEVNELLARAHVFVNTSVFEGFPNTFIQAWMREVPVVSLSVDPDGVLERCSVGVHAVTESELGKAVRKLATDAGLRARMGVRARDHALQVHSMRNASILAELIERGSVPPAFASL